MNRNEARCKITEIVLLALWRERNGDCPHGTMHDREMWRQTAVDRYTHDNEFYQKVNAAAGCIFEIVEKLLDSELDDLQQQLDLAVDANEALTMEDAKT